MGDKMLGRGEFPWLWYEDNLSHFPLWQEVPFEQDYVEQLCKILNSSSWRSFEDFSGDEVVPW
jgi:hypothetical protein